MLFSSETRRLKSAIHAQDSQLSQSIADLAATIGLGKASMRAMGVAKSHPVPVALAGATIAGAGLAYMMLRPTVSELAAKRRGPLSETLARWEDEGGPVRGAADVVDRLEEKGNDWLEAAREAKDLAREKLLDLYERGLATAEAKAAVAAEQAEGVASAMRNGLGNLSDEAAELALEARRKAWDAVDRGGRYASRGLDEGRRMAQEHPVAASVVGIAAGAGLVALALRGRGIFKLLAPVALVAAATQFVSRLNQGQSFEDMAEDVKHTADEAVRSAGKAVRRGTRKAEDLAEDVTEKASRTAGKAARTATEAAGTAKSKVKAAARSTAKTGARKARATADKAADAVEKAGSKAADKISETAAAAEAAVNDAVRS
ncbi:hypothetical protein Q9295_05975 [Xinfangfangia sp. CPCC 101601]|uniref:DUF3618 domain-containing protein n=1 Tax=Pseudogemmobacter lacusdianii TaxID=3069608 RepID=A0ABU0VYD3_9RHOB|nr:hypothetical protein [Xinfangfangia sp. CPCC 101601]MDQ2065910.1 hypothetical protein [Xinfangfangia sp. CPCC 101601]